MLCLQCKLFIYYFEDRMMISDWIEDANGSYYLIAPVACTLVILASQSHLPPLPQGPQ